MGNATQATYVRLPVELHAAIKQRAALEERNMAQTIRVALRYYLSHTEVASTGGQTG